MSTEKPQNDLAQAAGLPIMINAQYVKDLSFENPNATRNFDPMMSQPEVNINLGVNAVAIADSAYEVTLSIRAEAKRSAPGQEPLVAFLVELAYAGIFTLKDIPAQHVQPILFIEGPRLLFPFARQIVADVTANGGFPPLMVNPIDFTELYRQQQDMLQQPKVANA